jgi:glycosyltransferase involved in cell wall biosynthesis
MPHLEARDIVCFANDWSGDPLSKKHVMQRLARRNRILWVNSLGNRRPRATAHDLRRIFDKLKRFAGGLYQVDEHIHVLSPLAVPSYRSPLMRRLNQLVVGTTVRAAMKQLGFRRPLLYTFVPASAWVVDQLGCEQVVYHCVDEFSQFDGAGQEIAELERDLIRKSDLVITCSTPLAQAKSLLHPNTVLVRHGVDCELFARALDPATPIPADIAALPRPIIGFYGLLAEWVDLEAMQRVAQAFPQGSLAIVGDINNADRSRLARLHACPNVHFFGHRPYEALPGYCKAFDVALLPFVKNHLTESASPLKLREYLAAGLPVVATDIPEAAALAELVPNGVFLASSSEAFVEGVKWALHAGPGPSRARSEAMSQESWDAKVEQIETTLLRLQT